MFPKENFVRGYFKIDYGRWGEYIKNNAKI